VPAASGSATQADLSAALLPATVPPIVYRLSELAEMLGIGGEAPEPRAAAPRPPWPPRPDGPKSQGWAGVYRNRLSQFEYLRKIRSGFHAGCRNHAALLYASLLKRIGIEAGQIVRRMAKLGRECHPPLSKAETGSAMGSAQRLAKIRSETISGWFGITHAEHLQLRLKFGRYAWKAAVEHQQPIVKRQIARRERIPAIIAGRGHVPSIREMAAVLTAEGFPVGRSQVAKDYRALDLKSGGGVN
jgi:hypothetical protein